MTRLFLALLLAAGLARADAAEIVVLSSQGVASVLEALTPEFEKATGDKLMVKFGVSQTIKSEIDGGAPFDVTILARDQIDLAVSQGSVTAASVKDIAKSGIGIAIKAGAPKPDISTPDGLKRAFLAAKGVAYTSVGASGMYLPKLFDKFGITEQMAPKLRPQPSGRAGDQVARGEADLAFQQISELLPVAGTELVGPLPSELQIYTSFTAGIGAKAKNPAGAKALIDFLTAPSHAKLIAEKGMQAAN